MDIKRIKLKEGDIFFTKGTGFLSKAIRFCTRSIGEKRTKVNHVGIVVEEGYVSTTVVVEALDRVMCHRLWYQYGPPDKNMIMVYRPINLTKEEITTVINAAKNQVGKKYGYIKIVAHLLDWSLFGAYAFRRLVPGKKYPICSWVVAYAFSVICRNFGVTKEMATPDDILDYVEASDNYFLVRPLSKLY